MNKPIYFYLKFLLIIIIIFISYFILRELYGVPAIQKDIKPGVISPTWEDCLDRLNSNPLVKDIRWDEKTKVCSVLQSVNTDNTNPNTISDSLKSCSSYSSCPFDKKDIICGLHGEILPKPTYWEFNTSTGECTKSISCTLGDQNNCYALERDCPKKISCPNNCNGPDNGKCDYSTGLCTCNPEKKGTKNNDCSYNGPGTCSCPYGHNCINFCNGPRHPVPYEAPPLYSGIWRCDCLPD